MKKVISITLGGLVFSIEEDAYTALSAYLEEIKSNLSSSDDYVEISQDIESAIAEKFTTRKRSEKMAVTKSDVDDVIREMGAPADFGEGAGEPASAAASPTGKKRLYRDTDDAIIAGVASGLARYFDIDPVIVRIIFVVSIFFNGLGILAYIILWLVVPKAETTEQKYAMRGEVVTLSHITDRVKKKLNEVDTEAISEKASQTWGGLKPFLTKLFSVLGIIVWVLIGFLRYVVGIAFVVAGAMGMASLIATSSVLWIADSRFADPELKAVADVFLSDPSSYVFVVALITVGLIPLLFLVMVGASLLSRRNLFTVTNTLALGVVWLTAFMLMGTIGVMSAPAALEEAQQFEKYFEGGDHWFYRSDDTDGKYIQIEKRSSIPAHTPEWTNPNESDPGTTQKESGEKSGTEDINIGVGELQESQYNESDLDFTRP